MTKVFLRALICDAKLFWGPEKEGKLKIVKSKNSKVKRKRLLVKRIKSLS